MTAIPAPRMNRATVSWATVLAEQAMMDPVMITQAPMNMDHRRPSLSEMMAAKGEARIVPLWATLATAWRCCAQKSQDDGRVCLHRVKRADDGHLGARQLGIEGIHERFHGGDGTNQRAIVTVGTRTAKCNEDGEIEVDGGLAPPLNGRLLDSCKKLGLGVEEQSASRKACSR